MKRFCQIVLLAISMCTSITNGAESNEQQASYTLEKTSSRLESTVLSIRTANKTNIETRLGELVLLSKELDVLAELLTLYEATPEADYGSRRFLIGLIGEYQDRRAFDLLLAELLKPLPSARSEHLMIGAAEEEEMVKVKAVHAIGYLRSMEAKEVLMRAMLEHESQLVRIEAVGTYMWNSRDQKSAAKELYGALPASLHPYIEKPRMHANIDRQTFDDEVAAWKRKWQD